MMGKVAPIDNSGIYWCQWCGDNIPDYRLHLATCSGKCASALNSDDRRRVREARNAQAAENVN